MYKKRPFGRFFYIVLCKSQVLVFGGVKKAARESGGLLQKD